MVVKTHGWEYSIDAVLGSYIDTQLAGRWKSSTPEGIRSGQTALNDLDRQNFLEGVLIDMSNLTHCMALMGLSSKNADNYTMNVWTKDSRARLAFGGIFQRNLQVVVGEQIKPLAIINYHKLEWEKNE